MRPENLQLVAARGEIRLTAKVVPRAARTQIVGLHGGALKINVSAPPERGKANQEVIKLLAETLGLRAGQLRVVSGGRSPLKTLAIQGLSAEQILSRLQPFL